ncbi:phosphodiesterase [Haematococcus lacustris]|uniref:Phosphodiesterase n=1 Tax=Haematococcus lacustris TaxID=44745 RepID=A0A699Z3Y6_HAELA|nr:phosphodiesterase [Haematococcus lacustris]
MENHHLAASFHLINSDEYNWMPKVTHKVREAIRKQVIDMVLATDMKSHFSIHSMFQASGQLGLQWQGHVHARQLLQVVGARKVLAHHIGTMGCFISGMEGCSYQGCWALYRLQGLPPVMHEEESRSAAVRPQAKMQLNGSRPSGGSDPKSMRNSPHNTSEGSGAHKIVDDDQRSLVLQVALKCADLGHLASPRAVHKKWVCYLEEVGVVSSSWCRCWAPYSQCPTGAERLVPSVVESVRGQLLSVSSVCPAAGPSGSSPAATSANQLT